MKKKLLIIRFDLEGSHNWPDAPHKYPLLKLPHGHIFYFEIKIQVTDSNREVEFLDFRQRIISHLSNLFGVPLTLGGRSCEMIADEIQNMISHMDVHSVTVMEDKFVGAEVIYESSTD